MLRWKLNNIEAVGRLLPLCATEPAGTMNLVYCGSVRQP